MIIESELNFFFNFMKGIHVFGEVIVGESSFCVTNHTCMRGIQHLFVTRVMKSATTHGGFTLIWMAEETVASVTRNEFGLFGMFTTYKSVFCEVSAWFTRRLRDSGASVPVHIDELEIDK
jgi:hypothetical protein